MDTIPDKVRAALAGRTRWRLVAACALSLGISVPVSFAGNVHGLARTALEHFETIRVLEAHGPLAQQHALLVTTHEGGIGLQVQPPCVAGESACYVALRIERSPILLIGFTALVLFMVLLGATGIVLTLISERPVLEGKQLIISETISKQGRTTIQRHYKGLRTSESQLRIPVELRSGDGAQFAIDKLKVRAAPYLRAKLVPEFKKGCSHYAGAIEFAPHTCGPIDVELETTLTSPYYRNAQQLRETKSNPQAELNDQASFIMPAHWSSVRIRMKWPEGHHFAFDGHPWVEMQRTEAADAERLPAGSAWKPEQWELDLKDVSAGQVYSIRWRLQDEQEEEAENEAAG